jgi:glycine betaine/proline transport system substrate-binding protein
MSHSELSRARGPFAGLLKGRGFAKLAILGGPRVIDFAARSAILVALLGLTFSAAEAQDMPLKAPDVTTLSAPPARTSTGDITTPSSGASANAADSSSGDDNGSGGNDSDNSPPPPCGTQPISIASMGWPSAELLAAIHARILKAQFDCTVQVLPSDIGSALSGMASTGQPAVAPEMWIDRIAEQWNAASKDQKLRQVGLTYAESQFEGWYVPDYVMSAHPELKSAMSLKADSSIFADAGGKPKFISCPADWACSVINRNLIKAEGLDGLYDIVEPKNRYDLDQTIAAAVSRKQPIVFYYWQPNAALSQFSFKPVDLGPYSKDNFTCLGKRNCGDPKASGFAPEPVVIALADWVFSGAPDVAAYFQRAEMPMDAMNAMLVQLNAPGANVDSVADKFIADQTAVWQKWIGTEPGGSTGSSTDDADKPPPAGAAPPVRQITRSAPAAPPAATPVPASPARPTQPPASIAP